MYDQHEDLMLSQNFWMRMASSAVSMFSIIGANLCFYTEYSRAGSTDTKIGRIHEEKIEKSKEALSRDPTMESLVSEFNASIDQVVIK